MVSDNRPERILRDAYLPIRIPEDVKQAAQRCAYQLDETLSRFVRRAIRRELKRVDYP